MNKKKVVGYIRVSTQEQANEGVSLANQEEKIRVYCSLKDFDLIEIVRDGGETGKNLKRPGIQRIMEMAAKREIEAVIVYKLDRLTRKTRDLLFLVEDVFVKNGIDFYSLNETIDTTTAQGKFFLTIMGAMAQIERDLISERTTDALRHLKVKENRRLGSPARPPYGFSQNNRTKATISDLKADKEGISRVMEMFRLRKKKKSLADIGKRYGLAKSSVSYILNNPIYKQKGLLCVQ